MQKKLKVAVVSSEAVPYSKTGGLADVAGILPLEIKKLGREAILVLPYYKDTKKTNIPIKKISDTLAKTEDEVTAYFIINDKYFDREGLYGTPKGDYPDNAYRFNFFCKKTIELLEEIDFIPDIIHVNDWQACLIPFYLRACEKNNPFYKQTKILLTIHNMAYQGLFSPDFLPEMGLGKDALLVNRNLEFYGKLSFLKTGLAYADAINTVSKKYSQEIQTKEYGCGMEGILKERGKDLYGILNGVDYNHWNPETDKFIVKKYSIKDLDGKRECRSDLLKQFNLSANDETPVIGIISRLADQKGFDILAGCMDKLANQDLRLVILGTGEERYHKMFRNIEKKYPSHFGVKIEFNNSIAHKIEAGSDMFLMPSRFEPCGLNQIYSLKYGTVPIVRATGGLDDTIENFNVQSCAGNGFKFVEYSSSALLGKIKEALAVFKDKELWQKLMQNGMRQDFSWHKSAQEYVELYNKMLNRKAANE